MADPMREPTFVCDDGLPDDDDCCGLCGGVGFFPDDCTCMDDTCCCLFPDPPTCPDCNGNG